MTDQTQTLMPPAASLASLFLAIATRPDLADLVAVGRAYPREDGTLAHVPIAYEHTDPTWDDRPYVVHTAVVDDDGVLRLVHGDYDLTFDEATKHPRITGKERE